MAGWEDTRPLVSYQIFWRDGTIDAVQAQGINSQDTSGHIQFWRAHQMILSVNGADVRQVRLANPGTGIVQ